MAPGTALSPAAAGEVQAVAGQEPGQDSLAQEQGEAAGAAKEKSEDEEV